MKQKKIGFHVGILSGIAGIIAVFLLSICLLEFRVDNQTIDHTYVTHMNENWKQDGKSISLPANAKETNGQVILENVIPRSYWGMTLSFYTETAQIRVYLDDILQYQFGTKDSHKFGISSGSSWHFIEIPSDLSAGRVKIVFKDPYQEDVLSIKPVVVGSRDACTWRVFKMLVPALITAGVVFLSGILLFGIFIWLRVARAKTMGLFYLSIGLLLCATDFIIESGVAQFFYGNQYFYLLSDSMFLLLFPLFFLAFYKRCYFCFAKKVLNVVIALVSILDITCLILQCMNIVDLPAIRVYCRMFMALLVFLMLIMVLIHSDRVERIKECRFVSFFTLIPLVCVIVDLVRKQNAGIQDSRLFTRVGIAFFSMCMVYVFARRVSGMFTESLRKQAELYRLEKESVSKQNELLNLAKEATEHANEVLDQYNRNLEVTVTEKTEEIRQLQQNVIEGFANLIENRDAFTGQHVKRTSTYVEIIVQGLIRNGKYRDELQNEYSDISLIRKAAPLHDIGKIVVPDAILSKPGKLTKEEFDVIKNHTVVSDTIIDQCLTGLESEVYLAVAKDMAIYHHEKFDGTGYPKGLVGEQIPLCARIMAVADVFDALISKRSYKEPFSFDEAFEIIKESSGTHFDPVIVDTFLEEREQVEQVTMKL